MNALWQDMRYGARMLLKKPGFTLVAVVTLALGIGANTAIFSVVNAALLRPLPYPDSDQLVMVGSSKEDGPSNTGFTTYVDWRERNKSFEEMAMIRSWGGILSGQGEPEMIEGVRVSSNYFRMLGVSPIIGRDFKLEEDRPDTRFVIMLSNALWQRRFNSDPDIAGRLINFSDQTFTVAGVMPQGFSDYIAENFYEPPDVWAPIGYDVAQPWACRDCQHLKAVGRLKRGVSIEEAATEMTAIQTVLQSEHPTIYPSPNVSVARLQDKFVGEIRPALYMLLVAVGFVLLIACANVANLLLARANQRSREMAIRSALGASRWRIIRQLLAESVTLSLLGAGGGLLLAIWGTEFLTSLSTSKILQLQGVETDARVLAFTLAVSLLTGLLFGLFPAMQAARQDVQTALKESGNNSQSGRQHRFRAALVVAEVALALVLLVGAGLLIKSFSRILNVQPGFEPRNLLTMMVPAVGERYNENEQVRLFYRDVLEQVKALPGVESVGIVSNLPFGGNMDQSSFHVEEKPLSNPADAPSAERYGISPDYLRAMGIPLLRGRGFTEQDNANTPLVALINETAARRIWLNEDPIGKRIRLGDHESPLRTIVGITGDVNHYGLDERPEMQTYVPHAQWTNSYMQLVVRTPDEPASLTTAVRDKIREVDPALPVYKITTMNQLISASVAQRRLTLLLLGIFAAVAVLMAGIGIYGVMSYAVSQRTPEIGIRMALGAQTRDVLRLVIRQGMLLALGGVALGLIASFGLTRLMTSLLFGVSATDAVTFAAVALLLSGVAFLACWIPARRAAKVDPMEALRYE